MPSYEAWKKLLSNDWASCVKIHNLPFSFKSTIVVPVYDMGLSAETWSYFDFKQAKAQAQARCTGLADHFQ